MLKKLLIIVILIGCSVLMFVAYSFLKNEVQKNRSPLEAVPIDAAVLLESNDVRTVWSRISETNLVWSTLMGIPEVKSLDQSLRTVDSLFSTKEKLENILHHQEFVFSLHPNGDLFDLFSSVVCSEEQFLSFKELILSNSEKSEKGEGDNNINQVQLAGDKYYFTYYHPFLLFSSSQGVIETGISQIKNKNSLLNNEDFKSLKQTTHGSIALSCYLNFSQLGRAMAPHLTKEVAELWQSGNLFPSWAEFDLRLKSDAVIFSGLSTTDSKNIFLKSVSEQKANQSVLQSNLPKFLNLVKRVALEDPKKFVLENNEAYLNKLEESCFCDPVETVSSWMGSEMTLVEFSKYQNGNNLHQALIIEANGTENLLGRLTSFGVQDSSVGTLSSVDVYKLEDNQFLGMFGEGFVPEGDLFFSQIMGYAVFSTWEGMKNIAYQWKKEETIVQQSQYRSFSERLMANFSSSDYFSGVSNIIEQSANFLKKETHQKLQKNEDVFKKLGGVVWQTGGAENDLQYHSIAMNVDQGSEQNPNTLWELTLKTNVNRAPELMKNHRTKTLEVLLQDDLNTIHLVGATGKIKWSKKIEGPVIGKVKQIDIYANNKYQMLFNTSSKIHLIDINGNEVKGYPIELKSPATNSVTVLDYENKKDYRFLIASFNKKIYNYDKLGSIVEGWEFKGTESVVLNEARHFVSDNKDYILITDLNGKIYLLDRRGRERVVLNSTINTNIHELIDFRKGSSFTTSKITYKDTTENICELLLNDTKNCFQLDTIKNYQLKISDLNNDDYKEYIVSYKNRFDIYGVDKELVYFETFDFAVGNEIEIIGRENGNKYILIGNGEEIHIYNHKFAPLVGFPRPGSKLTVIGDINSDGKTNLVTVLNSNRLIVYSIDGLGSL